MSTCRTSPDLYNLLTAMDQVALEHFMMSSTVGITSICLLLFVCRILRVGAIEQNATLNA